MPHAEGQNIRVAGRSASPLGAVLRVVAFPFVAVRSLFGGPAPRQVKRRGEPLSKDAILAALVLRSALDDAESQFLRENMKQIRSMVETQDWDALSDLLSEWDTEGEVSPTGVRLAQLALDHFWQTDVEEAVVDAATNRRSVPAKLMRTLANLHRDKPSDYVYATLLARAHLGSACAADESSDGEKEKTKHFETAADVMAPLDAKRLSSPMVARLKYEYLSERGSDLSALSDAYEVLIDTDVGNLETYRAHGGKLTPSVTGDAAQLDQVARDTLTKTETELGAAAYAALYEVPLQKDDEALLLVDFDLFEAGVQEIISLANDDPFTVNRVASELMLLCEPREQDSPELTERRSEVRLILKSTIEQNLSVLLPYLWSWDEETIRHKIGQLFENDIREGKRVVLGKEDTPAPPNGGGRMDMAA